MSRSEPYYFACARPEDIGQSLVARLEEIRKRDETASARKDQFALAYNHYYGWDLGQGSTSEVARGGDQGELATIRVNHARRAGKSLLSLLLGPRFSWRPQAPNGSVGGRKARLLADAILEHQMKRRKLALLIARWVEVGIVTSEAFIFSEWDVSEGPEIGIDEETGQTLREGDITYRVLPPWDVTREPDAKCFDESPFLYARVWRNKWDLAAMYGQDILGQPCAEKIVAATDDARVRSLSGALHFPASGDLIPVNYFFHRPSPALPEGRETLFVNADVVLRDRRLKPVYPSGIPLTRFAIDEQFDTPHAYSSWWDVLASQEAIDGVESAVATNLLNYGTQSIAIEQGTKSSVDSAYGAKAFYFPRGGKPPSPLMVATLPPQALEYLDRKEGQMLQLVGLNETFMGSPNTAQMNAQAFALLSSMAVQANSPSQNMLLEALSTLGTNILGVYSANVTEPRLVPVVGKQNKSILTAMRYVGSELAPIEACPVDIGNALEQTAPGRFQLATLYADRGWLTTPEQCQQVLETGRMEPAVQSLRNRLLILQAENEDLKDGKEPQVHACDDHLMHFKEHAGDVLNDSEARGDAQVLQVTHAHLDAHYREYWGLPTHRINPMTGMPELDPMTGQPIPMTVQEDPQYPVRLRIMLGQVPPAMAGPLDPLAGSPAQMPAPEGGAPVDGAAPALAGSPFAAAGATQPPNPVAGGSPFDPAGGGIGAAPLAVQ